MIFCASSPQNFWSSFSPLSFRLYRESLREYRSSTSRSASHSCRNVATGSALRRKNSARASNTRLALSTLALSFSK